MAPMFDKVYWIQKGTNKKFEFDSDKMKKEDYNVKGCRLPVPPLEKDEIFLYREGWSDDGESYIICSTKYLKGN